MIHNSPTVANGRNYIVWTNPENVIMLDRHNGITWSDLRNKLDKQVREIKKQED
jgi:hypothetical protein